MKILHIIDHIGIGGAQTIIKGIFEKELGNKNFYYYAIRNNKVKIEIERSNAYLYKGYSKFNIGSFFKLRNIIKHQDIEILHCHLVKSMLWGYCMKLLFFRDIKLIFHEHGRIFQKKKPYNFFLKKAQKRVDLFIAVSKATKRSIIENADIEEDKITVLYNFVDLNYFSEEKMKIDRLEKRKKLGLSNEDFIIGFAGRLNKVKGCEHFLKSIPHLSIPNFKVLIAGEGNERKKLEKLANNLNISNKVIFLGYINKIINFYGMIDLLVVPSKYESFGISVIEAQACHVPVIASDVEALNEIIKNEENGLLFEPENEIDLIEKILLLYNDTKIRDKIITNSLEDIKKYSINNYLTKLYLIYDQINKCEP